jgi:prophage tail gpP-like protein
MGKVTLRLGTVDWTGWLSASLTRRMDQASATFALELTERWAGQPNRRVILPGTAAQLWLDGRQMVNGFVDEVAVAYDATSHRVSVSGRDRLGDLVDSAAAVDGAHQWSGLDLTGLARSIIAPFGVPLTQETDVGAVFENFAVQPGEQAMAALARAARARAVLIMGDGLGGLVLTRAGGAGRMAGTLALGRNVLAASGRFSLRFVETINEHIERC